MGKKFALIIGLVSSYLVGITVSVLAWDRIRIPFSNPYNVVGKLTLEQFNPINNYLRWGVVVTLPSVIFFLYYLLYLKKISPSPRMFAISSSKVKPPKVNNILNKNYLNISFAIFLTLLIANFLSKDWSTSAFDMFHEGEQITPAYNYINGKGLWSGTLFVHGLIYDVLTAFLGWKIFGVESIGSYRFALEVLKLTKDIGLLFLFYKLACFLFDEIKNRIDSLLILSFIIFSYIFTLRIQNLDRRMFPLILLIALMIGLIHKARRYSYFLLGILTGFGFFYSLDVGLYALLISLFFIFFQLVFNNRPLLNVSMFLLKFLSGFFTIFLFVFLLVGKVEFKFFVKDFLYFLRVKDLLDSYVYPNPLYLSNLRFTIPILISSLNLLFLLFLFLFVYHEEKFKNIKIFHLMIQLISILIYRSALGRSDLIHIETSSTFIFITLGLNMGILFYLVVFHRIFKKYLSITIFILSLIFLASSTNLNISNILSFRSRLLEHIYADDIYYVNEVRRDGIYRLRDIFNNESCVYNITSEASLPYLIKKPSCGRYYISYLASADPARLDLSITINSEKPKYIIYSTKGWTQDMDNISNNERFKDLMSNIEENYRLYENVSDYWSVCVRK